eukprot:scaffold3704_cov90-Cylindrotheca_fusiformis.AAC.2
MNQNGGSAGVSSLTSLSLLKIVPCPPKALYFVVLLTALLGIILTAVSNNALKQNTVGRRASNVPSSEVVVVKHQHEYEYPSVLYGHVHMAKTGGTSLNGLLANRFTRICGHKGYSYDAYNANLRAKQKEENGERVVARHVPRDQVESSIMKEIGFHDCDWISHETSYKFWISSFGDSKFFGIPMELHIPCREPLDHLMSFCNYAHEKIDCDDDDEDFYEVIEDCLYVQTRFHRFDPELLDHFDVKCYDFKKQFTSYIEDVMAPELQPRRLPSDRFVQRETNRKRNKTNECIWERPDLQEKAKAYLLQKPYYQFCQDCLGSENDLTKGY